MERIQSTFCWTILLCVAAGCTGELKIIGRHNYGVVMTKRGGVQVATAMARLIFTYQLPEMLSPIRRDLDVDCR